MPHPLDIDSQALESVRGLTVAVAPDPLGIRRDIVEVRPGASIHDILLQVGVDPLRAYVEIDAQAIESSWYRRVSPKPGAVVVVRALPRGGRAGKAVLAIVVGVGLAIVGGFAAAAAAQAGTSLVTGIGGIVSGLAAVGSGIYSLASPPPDAGKSREPGTAALFAPTRNQATPYADVWRNYGRNRMYGRLAAKPFTRMVGNNPRYIVLLDFGYGPNAVEDIKVGDTPIAKFDVEYEIHEGWDDDSNLSIYRRSVDELTVGRVLKLGNEGEWFSATTALDTELATLVLQFQGLVAYSNRGNPKYVEIECNLEYRLTSGGAWTPVTFGGIRLPNGVRWDGVAGQFFVRGERAGSVLRAVEFKLPSRDQYDVRLRRVVDGRTIEGDPTDPPPERQISDDMTWALLQSSRPGAKPTVPNLTLLEMEFDTKDEAFGVVDTVNAVVTSYLPVWNQVDGWGLPDRLSTNPAFQLSRSAAWAFAENLRGPQNPQPVSDDRVDGEQLLAWDSYLSSIAHTFRAVIDGEASGGGGTVFDVAANIAKAGRAMFNVIDGKYSVSINQPQTTRVQTFSDRNSRLIKVERKFRKAVEGYRVTFVDPDMGYEINERIVYGQGFSEATARTLSDLDYTFGLDSADAAYTDAKMHEASVQLQPRSVLIETDSEYLVATRGDRVGYRHDAMLLGLKSGRLSSVNVVAGELVSARVDVQLEYPDPTKEYGVIIRTSDADYSGRVSPSTDPYAVVFVDTVTIDPADRDPAKGDLFSFGEFGKIDGDFVINVVSPSRNLGARLELLDYNEAIYTADTDPIPPYDPLITLPSSPSVVRPPSPQIDVVAADERVFAFSEAGTKNVGIAVWYSLPATAEAPVPTDVVMDHQIVHADGQLDDWIRGGSVDARSGVVVSLGLDEGLTYNVRVRSLGPTGVASDWSNADGVLVTGGLNPPPDPINIRAEGSTTIAWSYPDPPADLAGFEVRFQRGTVPSWSTGVQLNDGLLLTVPRLDLDNEDVPNGTVVFMVKAVDTSGIESEGFASLVQQIAKRLPDGVVQQVDHRAGVWTAGTPFLCTPDAADNNYLKADLQSAGDPFWPSDMSAPFWPADMSTPFWSTSYFTASYLFEFDPNSGIPDPWPGFVNIEVDASDGATAIYSIGDINGEYAPLPARLPVEDRGDPILYVIVQVPGGSERGIIRDVFVNYIRPDLTIRMDSEVLVAGVNNITIPPVGTGFFKLTGVQVTPIDNSSINVVVVNKDLSANPLQLQAFDSSGVSVGTTVDILLEGY